MSYGLLKWTVMHLKVLGLFSDSYLDITFLDAMHKYNMWTDDVVMSRRHYILEGRAECRISQVTPYFLFIAF